MMQKNLHRLITLAAVLAICLMIPACAAATAGDEGQTEQGDDIGTPDQSRDQDSADLMGFSIMALSGQMPGLETPICINPQDQNYPDIAGDWIVWEDNRSGVTQTYLYDIKTGQEKVINATGTSQAFPAISGNKVVWQDKRSGAWDIYLYDVGAKTETALSSNPSAQFMPAIDGNNVVWYDVGGGLHVHLYNLATKKEFAIDSTPVTRWWPSVSGDRVVWEDSRNGNSDIYLYYAGNGTVRRITTDSADQSYAAISGSMIVWEDYRNGNADIYAYDLASNKEIPVCTEAGDQVSPAIDGNMVSWEDKRSGDWDVYIYDLGTDTEYQITSAIRQQWFSKISGNRIVWQDLRSHNWDIYMYTFEAAEGLKAGIKANQTSGAAPLAVGFTDISAGDPVAWEWDFGDGNTSSRQNPVHVYIEPGNYTVTLEVSNATATDTVTRENYIRVYAVVTPLAANFTAEPTNGTEPLEVAFTDASTGNVTAWEWDFGDGNTSTEQNPTNIYVQPGTYTVTLAVSNATTTVNTTKEEYIRVLEYVEAFAADFTATPTSGTVPLAVQFNDTTRGGAVSSWNWTFGDGEFAIEQNPLHTYAAVGTYTVILFVTTTDENATAENSTVEKADCITVSPVQTPAYSSGGGGGGGSSRKSSAKSVVQTPEPLPTPAPEPVVAIATDENGTVTEPVTVAAGDNVTSLFLDEGTVALDGEGLPLAGINMTPLASGDVPAVPNGSAFSFAGYAYTFGPANATFDPAVLLAFNLSAEEWENATANGSAFLVQWYNTTVGAWESIPSTVDAGNRTVTAEISHFSIYGLFTEAVVVPTPESTPVEAVAVATTTPAAGLPGVYAVLFVGGSLVIAGVVLYVTRSRKH